MNFYVDETGHTGPNLFDRTQRVLSYGVLSSPDDLDKVELEMVDVGWKAADYTMLGDQGDVSP